MIMYMLHDAQGVFESVYLFSMARFERGDWS